MTKQRADVFATELNIIVNAGKLSNSDVIKQAQDSYNANLVKLGLAQAELNSVKIKTVKMFFSFIGSRFKFFTGNFTNFGNFNLLYFIINLLII